MSPDINAVDKTAHLINSEGVGSVILAVFIIIYLVSQYAQWRQNRLDRKSDLSERNNFYNLIAEQNKQFFDILMNERNKSNETLYEEKNLMDLFMKLNSRLREDCREALEVLNADRTAIYAFHNGSQSTHGLPFFKFSCVCEYIARGSGSKSKMKTHSAIPINLLDEVMDILWKDGHYEYFQTDDPDENNFVNKLLLQGDNKTCILYTIYDLDNKGIGFIASEFSEDSFTREELREKKKYLKYLSEKLAPLLEFSTFKKNMDR